MTRRRILDVTSRKKQDNMLAHVVNDDGTENDGAITLQSNIVLACLFVPTARRTRTNITDPQLRNSAKTFSVGYKERVDMFVQGGGAWQWRRIVFTIRSGSLLAALDGIPGKSVVENQLFLQQSSGGCQRVIGPLALPTQEAVTALLFKGQEGSDWRTPLNAKIDTSRITLVFDKLYSLNSGNESGFVRSFRHWFPTKKNLVYDDDMESNLVGDSPFSVDAKGSMGDLFVFDYIQAVVPSSGSSQQLIFSPQGTYYWHEH